MTDETPGPRRYISRTWLTVIGMAPFVFFLLLLPPDRPQGSTPTGAVSSPSPSPTGVQLEFPAIGSATTTVSAEPSSSPSPAPSSRPSSSIAPSPGPATTTVTTVPPSPAPRTPRFGGHVPACSNGVDDDGDGSSDLGDPGCRSGSDPAESDNPACSDGLDDDGDGTVDSGDPGCSSPRDASEADDNQVSPNDNQEPAETTTDPPPEPGGEGEDGVDDGFPLEGLPS